MMNKYWGLLNDFIDWRIEMCGLYNTIIYLLDNDISEEELINEFHFSENDIEDAKELASKDEIF